MKRLLLLLILVLPACAPSKDEIVGECQILVDQAVEESYDNCTNFYETEVIPQLILLIENLKTFIAQECN